MLNIGLCKCDFRSALRLPISSYVMFIMYNVVLGDSRVDTVNEYDSYFMSDGM